MLLPLPGREPYVELAFNPPGSSAVVDGVIQYLSPSALKTADPEQGGCLRKWWYRYVWGIKDPETEPQKIGKACHAENERYQRTGDRSLSALTMKTWPWMPPRHPHNLVEHQINPAHRMIHSAGVPIKGYIDLVNMTGETITPMGAVEPSPLIEIIDWKFPGDLRFALNSSSIVRDYQMALYAEYSLRAWEQEQVRISLVYGPRKVARGKKISVVVDYNRIAQTLDKAAITAQKLIQIARVRNVADIEPNLKACDGFGGCPRQDRCPKTTTQIASLIFGENAMSLLPQQPAQTVGAQVDPVVQAKILALTGGAAPAPEPVRIDPAFVAALNYIQIQGVGRPALTGTAAAMYAASAGQTALERYDGMGQAASVEISDPAVAIQLAREVQEMPNVTAKFEPPAAVLPADAPLSNPALAADPVENPPPGVTNPPAPVPAALPPIVAAPVPAPAPQAPAPVALPTPAPAAPTSGHSAEDLEAHAAILELCATDTSGSSASARAKHWKESRKPALIAAFKVEHSLKAGAAPAQSAPDTSRGDTASYELGFAAGKASVPVAATDMQEARETLEIFVNCAVQNAKDLAPWVRALCDSICRQFGAVDLRSAPQDGPLGYGRWKGALAAMVRENPPPAGRYALDTRGSEIAEVVAEALQPHTIARGY